MTDPVLPGEVIGVLGGGQLGRMFALAARRMGYHVDVLAPDDDTPAGQIAYREVRAPYDDLDAVERLARGVSVMTFEFENVPSAAVEVASRHVPVRPAGSLLHATQNRAREKEALTAQGLPVAVHEVVRSVEGLARAAELVGFPAVLKTASWGYDGKGQRRVEDATDLRTAFESLGGGPAVLERLVPFVAELSVVGARGLDGSVALYDPVLNHHRDHILDVTVCPATVPIQVHHDALDIARAVLEGFEVVGVLAVELFLLDDGSLLVNELAPRPHNSGHVTMDAYPSCQFEQQVRSVCGLPLGSTERVVPAAACANLLGDLWTDGTPAWTRLLAEPGAHLHLYGKTDARPGRKMGHVTVAAATPEKAEARVRAVRDTLCVQQQEVAWTGA